VDDATWEEAVADLRETFKNVSVSDLQMTLDRLRSGHINGSYCHVSEDDRYPEYGACGCLIATAGNILIERGLGEERREYEAFNKVYAADQPVIRFFTPFQCWLYGIRPGDTPETNSFARAFAIELVKMIAERQNAV